MYNVADKMITGCKFDFAILTLQIPIACFRPLNSHDLVVRHTISALMSRPLADLTISHDFQQNFM